MGRVYVSFFKTLTWNFFFYSQQVDRLWRKNRRPVLSVGSVNIIGVDLNRNFPNENWGAYSFQIWFWMIQIWIYVEIDRYQIWFCWSKYWIYYKNLPEKPAENSQSHHCFPREMTSDERAQKFHTGDISLTRSRQCFLLVEANFRHGTSWPQPLGIGHYREYFSSGDNAVSSLVLSQCYFRIFLMLRYKI